MSHEQNDKLKLTDKSTVSQFDDAASRAGGLMRDEVYGNGPGHTASDGHNHSGVVQNFSADQGREQHNHSRGDQNAIGRLDNANQIMPIDEGRAYGQMAQNASASLDKPLNPIGLDRAALTNMLQTGSLTYQQAISLSSPELASYLSSFKVSKPSA